ATAPALRPTTPRWRGPTRSWSREWHPVQRDSYSAFPRSGSAACAVAQAAETTRRKAAALGAKAERRTGKLPAEHARERGPVHGLVGGETRGDLRQVHVLERRNDAEVCVACAELEALGEVEDVLLRLDRAGVQGARVFRHRFLRHRPAAELLDRRDQCVAVTFVVRLEEDRGVEHRLLQQTALRAELVGVDGLVLEAERDVEDVDIARPVHAHGETAAG